VPEAPDTQPHRREVTSYVHHRARLTEGQQRAWDRWWPVRGREVADLLAGTAPFDPPAWFGRTAPLVLEIGSGMGESTAAMAAAAPEVDHVAVEVFEPGIAQLLMRLADAGLTNVAVLRGDAVALLRERVPSGSLDTVRIYFPDPWPKRRHRKRRLVQPDLVAVLADRLRPGGLLHLATDWADYAVQMRAVCAAEPRLRPAAGTSAEGCAPRPDWRPVTKFEQRARDEGRAVCDLLYHRE
jgi:tRNA (guanine-N7-)-methyltransferase